MTERQTPIPGSERRAPTGQRVGPCDPNEQAEVSVYLKPPAEPARGRPIP